MKGNEWGRGGCSVDVASDIGYGEDHVVTDAATSNPFDPSSRHYVGALGSVPSAIRSGENENTIGI